MTKRNDHTFAICAYKESPYLEECILSLKNQTVKSNIIMATSTPNEWIQGLAEKYEIPLYINTGEGGIAQDWNFAYRQAKTDYITIAHQDDIYEPNYLKMIFGELKKEECFYALMLVSLCLEYYILLMFQGQLYKTFYLNRLLLSVIPNQQ